MASEITKAANLPPKAGGSKSCIVQNLQHDQHRSHKFPTPPGDGRKDRVGSPGVERGPKPAEEKKATVRCQSSFQLQYRAGIGIVAPNHWNTLLFTGDNKRLFDPLGFQ